MPGSSRRRNGGMRGHRGRARYSTPPPPGPAPLSCSSYSIIGARSGDTPWSGRARLRCRLMAGNAVAVVTGAGSGIGRVVAQALLGAGWRVALAGRRAAALDDTVAGAGRPLGASGSRRALAVPTDVADPASVEHLFAAVRAEWGRV